MPNTSRVEDRTEWRIAAVLFCLLLGISAWLLTLGWKNGNLPGHEFRQTQTALSALFIQRDGHFTLAYPTPVLGAPWAVPMEFPLYQWMTVVVSNQTGWPIVQAGRAVSALGLYLALAALWPLLGRLGLAPARRLVVMGFVLTCPVYLFYSRGFLIETTELALSLWFLAAFTRFIAGNKLKWLPIVTALGVAAGVVKVTTFMVFLIPAGFLTLLEMNRARSRGWWAALQPGVWALAAIALPVAATAWWTHFADGVKTANLSAHFLRSSNLTEFNFGNAESRFAAATWAGHWRNLTHGIAAPALLLVALALALSLARRIWRQVLFCVICYVLPLVIFPTLYSWHDYYSLANAVLLLTAIGLVAAAMLDVRRKWIAWVVLIALHGTQLWLYRQSYVPLQVHVSPGGSDMTEAVRYMTDQDDAIITAGKDWDSGVAFYSQRRALMIRAGMERDWTYLHEAFKSQKGQAYTVFIDYGNHLGNANLLQLLDEYFQIDPRPLFRWEEATVYGRRDRRAIMVDALRRHKAMIPRVELDSSTDKEDYAITNREVRTDDLLKDQQEIMSLFSPRPWKFFHQFGSAWGQEEGRKVVLAHPLSRLWFHGSVGANTVRIEFCLLAGAYANDVPPGDQTDGVEFFVEKESANGDHERLKSVFLDPAKKTEDRGFHVMELPVQLAAGESIVVGCGSGPAGNLSRDWAAFSSIKISPGK